MKSALIAHSGQVLPTGGHLNLLRRYAFWGVGVSLRGELVVFAKQKQKGQSVIVTLCPSLLGTQLSQEVSKQFHILDGVNLRLHLFTQCDQLRLCVLA